MILYPRRLTAEGPPASISVFTSSSTNSGTGLSFSYRAGWHSLDNSEKERRAGRERKKPGRRGGRKGRRDSTTPFSKCETWQPARSTRSA